MHFITYGIERELCRIEAIEMFYGTGATIAIESDNQM